MRKNNVRKTKTDKVDTFVIAKTLMMQDSLRFLTLEDLDYLELKELGRFRQKLVKQRNIPYFLFNKTTLICIFISINVSLKLSQELDNRTINNKLFCGGSVNYSV